MAFNFKHSDFVLNGIDYIHDFNNIMSVMENNNKYYVLPKDNLNINQDNSKPTINFNFNIIIFSFILFVLIGLTILLILCTIKYRSILFKRRIKKVNSNEEIE